MSSYFLARELSHSPDSERNCFCGDIDDHADHSKFMRLGCKCVIHYHCLTQYLQFKLGDRNTMNLHGVCCPYGMACTSYKTVEDVHGDESLIYFITPLDLDNIVDYGSNHPSLQLYLDEAGCTCLTHDQVQVR